MPAASGLRQGGGNVQAPTATLPRAGFKSILRNLVARGLYATRLLQLMQKASKNYELQAVPGTALPRLRRGRHPKFAILCYHRVGTEGVPLFSKLSPRVFENQMRFLRKNYRIVSFDQLFLELQHPKSAEPAVAITFDDGYADLFSQAFPILQKYQIPAMIFLVVASIETGEVPWYDRIFLGLETFPGNTLNLVWDRPRRLPTKTARLEAAWEIICYLRTLPDPQRKELCAALEKQIVPPADRTRRMLNWNQVRAMHRQGIDFGSHTMTHPIVSRLKPAELEWELAESRRVLEDRLDCPVHDFAYPFGKIEDCGPATPKLLATCGYRSAVTTVPGINTPGTDPFELRRMQVVEDPSLAMFGFELGRLFFNPQPAADSDSASARAGTALSHPGEPARAAHSGADDA